MPYTSIMSIEIRELRNDDEWVDYAQLTIDTFGGSEPAESRANRWLHGYGAPPLGVAVFDGSEIVGGVCAPVVEQFFGGRPVRSGAGGATSLLPEYRREGIGSQLYRELIHVMEDAGLIMSAGWPATVSFYRKYCYEVMGREVTRVVDARLLLGLSGPGQLERDPLLKRREEVFALQRKIVRCWNGPVARTEAWWDAHRPSTGSRDQQRYGWVEDGVLTGVLLAERRPQRTLWVNELWTSTTNALLGLLGFLGAQESVIDRVEFGPAAQATNDEISGVLTRPQMTFNAGLPWAIGFLDVAKALAARGYPSAARAHLDLEVTGRPDGDPIRLRLEVEDGASHVTSGGTGTLRIDQRTLTGWYGGSLSVSRAVGLGLIHGEARDIATLELLAGDRSPWLPEHW
jgi:predicted acetyltransferase